MIGSRTLRLSGVLLLLAILCCPDAKGVDRTFAVEGGEFELGETPIVSEVPGDLEPGPYRLIAESGGESLLATVFKDQGKTYLGTVLPTVQSHRLQVYTIEPDKKPGDSERGVKLDVAPETINVTVGGKPLTTYRLDSGPKPCYYPLIGPEGKAVTRAFPLKEVAGETRDHPHHRSFWFTHGSVNKIDFWSEAKGHGTIKETSRPTLVSGPALGLIRTTDDWVGPDGAVVCSDERAVWIYDTKKGRVLDFDITIKANHGDVTFGDTKEGMFGLRVASTMDAKPPALGKITNAEGLTNDETWGKTSPWVDYVGPVDGSTVGIAILNHPDSFRYPTNWHVRTYGLFAANPFGYHDFGRKEPGEFTIANGKSIRFRYRLILHKGETSTAAIPLAFRSYTELPLAKVSN